MKNFKYILLFTILLTCCRVDVVAQEDSSDVVNKLLKVKNPEGVDFWLCFMKNFKEPKTITTSNALHLELFITGDEDANVVIEAKNIGLKEELFVPARTIKSIKIDPKAQIQSSEILEKSAAVHITSDNPISVYGLNRRFQTTDTYLGLPKRVLGNDYRVMCYSVSDGLMAQFAIVATENNTIVKIDPAANTTIFPDKEENRKMHSKGEIFQIRMNKGDVYQVASRFESGDCDLTGTKISANKKIAVFSGHQCAYVPKKVIACNHLVEQLPPLPSWGKHFYLGMLKPRSKYTYRVLANEDSTKVFEDAKLTRILKSGQFFEKTIEKNVQVSADKPILVSQYSQGFRNGDSIGDPMMLLISPTQQFLRKYRFATPINGSWKHYVNVVVPTNSISTMRLDGRGIDTVLFERLGLSRYSIAYLRIPFGTHVIEGAMPFGMYSYGFGYGADAFDAYGTMGGQSFMDYEPARDTLEPMAEALYEKEIMQIIFRDDRVDDTGIKNIKILDAVGIRAVVPVIEEGSPQVSMNVRPVNPSAPGRMIIEATDIALNTSVFTLCYVKDRKTKLFDFELNEGAEEQCLPEPGWDLGLFGKMSVFMHSADFSSSGKIVSKGKFSDAIGFGGYGGIILSRYVKPNLTLSGRLSFENYGGVISAPDSSLSQIREDTTGKLLPYQESRDLELKGIFMHIGFSAEWYYKEHLYLLGGLNFSLALSKSVDYYQKILIPDDITFANGSRVRVPDDAPDSFDNIKTLRLGIFAGAGFSYPIYHRVTAFAEGIFGYHFGSLISDGDWGMSQLSFVIGAKYNL